MQITINLNAPMWNEDNAQAFLDFILEEIWLNNSTTEDDARVINFIVDGEDYMDAYEGREEA